MRTASIIILLGICLSLFAPVAIVRSGTTPSDASYILTLNVCDNAGTGVMSNLDIPCVLESPCRLSVIDCAGSHEIYSPAFTPLLVSNQTEHPPRS
ncbi:MAG: hypothetical protein HY880_07130 [Deltaproteobacteria bacterium]|nr:hypothetical protein [Deltaproteobacteria bacterium]